jgi:predicted HAD superfamily phosphohydrolase YqeG
MVRSREVRLLRRAPLFVLQRPEDAFRIVPQPLALVVDLEGTLTAFDPALAAVMRAIRSFDRVAAANGIDADSVHYVSNASIDRFNTLSNGDLARIHLRACKPFFTPPDELISHGRATVVIGDEYLTDGITAWRFGLSFGLVRPVAMPLWPKFQRLMGSCIAPVFFERA